MRPIIVYIESESGRYLVTPKWDGVDRPITGGMSTGNGKNAKRDAHRLQKAMSSGMAFENAHVATDVNGKTYVSATCLILGRHLDRDLKKLGF